MRSTAQSMLDSSSDDETERWLRDAISHRDMQNTVDSVVGLSLRQIDQFAVVLFNTDQVAAERLTEQLNALSAGTGPRTNSMGIPRCATVPAGTTASTIPDMLSLSQHLPNPLCLVINN